MRRYRAALGMLVLPLLVATTVVPAARSQSETELQQQVSGAKSEQERQRKALRRIAAFERRLGRQVAIVERRLADVQASYDSAKARLDATRDDKQSQEARRLEMRKRLGRARTVLANQLRSTYMTPQPDLTTVVLTSGDVSELLDRLDFDRRLAARNASVLDAVRDARIDARRQVKALGRLERRREKITEQLASQRAAVSEIRGALAQRQQALSRARAARAAALSKSKTKRRRAERELRKLEAAQARGVNDTRGPGGPWAIPWPIVQCESGGQNLPPNSAGASGYYQFMPQTWQNLGGSTPNAYQASKAEQDRLAAKLWNGGAGARNWVCASLV